MLRVESDGPVLRVTLNRPEVRNAFNDALIAALTEAFATVPSGTRVVVLSGEGKAFCAGGDLEWMRRAAAYTEEQNYQDALKLSGLFRAVAECRAAVVAQIHGAAFGGGAGLVAASDIAVAHEDTQFAFSEVRLGLIPGTISPYVIPKIGAGHARSLFTTGESFGALRALQIGLIHACGPDVAALTEEKVKWLLSVGPNAVYEAKRIVLEYPLPAEECARRLAAARASEEGKEGVAAFLERRKAVFSIPRD